MSTYGELVSVFHGVAYYASRTFREGADKGSTDIVLLYIRPTVTVVSVSEREILD